MKKKYIKIVYIFTIVVNVIVNSYSYELDDINIIRKFRKEERNNED